MSTGIENSDFIYLRMEAAANTASVVVNKAAQEQRPLTRMEDARLTILKLEQFLSREEWAKAREAEGHSTKLFKILNRDTRESEIRIINSAGNKPVMYLYGEIGAQYDGITAEEFKQVLMEIPPDSDMELRVHSPGGIFRDGMAIHSLIANRPGRVDGYVDGLAASAATIILMACDSITMPRGASWMIHFSQAELHGSVEDLKWALDSMNDVNDAIVNLYMSRWNGTEQELRAALTAESWYTADQALTAGFIDRVSDMAAIAAKINPRHNYRHIPKHLAIAACATPRRDLAEMTTHQWMCI